MDQRASREAEEISATGDPVLRYVSGRVSPEWMIHAPIGSCTG
jgi:ribulose kinase